jgi:hypothetical protein
MKRAPKSSPVWDLDGDDVWFKSAPDSSYALNALEEGEGMPERNRVLVYVYFSISPPPGTFIQMKEQENNSNGMSDIRYSY